MPNTILDPTLAAPAPTGVRFGDPKTSVGKTLNSMLTRLQKELGNREDFDDADYKEFINDSYRDLSTSIDVPEMKGSFGFTTSSSQPFYLLPPGVRSVTLVSLLPTDDTVLIPSQPLKKLTVETYRTLAANSGIPTSAFRWLDMLVLYPTPDMAYNVSVDVRIKIQPLVADNDSPVLDEEWHEAIYRGAKARAFDATRDSTNSVLQENNMTRLVRRKIDTGGEEVEDMLSGMRPVKSASDYARQPWYTKAIYPNENCDRE
jgi:hypothetical protein